MRDSYPLFWVIGSLAQQLPQSSTRVIHQATSARRNSARMMRELAKQSSVALMGSGRYGVCECRWPHRPQRNAQADRPSGGGTGEVTDSR